jgi:hypothetical protein
MVRLTDENEGLLTKKELAKLLRVSTRKIELDPHLPRIIWGRSVRYKWAAVEAYLTKQGGGEK